MLKKVTSLVRIVVRQRHQSSNDVKDTWFKQDGATYIRCFVGCFAKFPCIIIKFQIDIFVECLCRKLETLEHIKTNIGKVTAELPPEIYKSSKGSAATKSSNAAI